MELLTQAVEEKFKQFPYLSQDGKGMDAEVLVRYFNPLGAGDWLITEAEEVEEDWILYGFCSLGYGYEFGPVSLKELQSIQLPFGMGIERDILLEDQTKVSDLISEEDRMY